MFPIAYVYVVGLSANVNAITTMTSDLQHPTLIKIQELFDARGALQYGEAINQIEHALQCGSLAEQDGATPNLVLAAWLHDIGHMQHRDAAAAVAQGSDDMHQVLGARLLAQWFGPAVAEPVRLHVDAKRYLCKRENGYWEHLSLVSKRTLEIQGGPMTEEEALDFERTPFHADAVLVRRWDDMGKQPGVITRSHAYFMTIAASRVHAD